MLDLLMVVMLLVAQLQLIRELVIAVRHFILTMLPLFQLHPMILGKIQAKQLPEAQLHPTPIHQLL
jgi:hypothetical protein